MGKNKTEYTVHLRVNVYEPEWQNQRRVLRNSGTIDLDLYGNRETLGLWVRSGRKIVKHWNTVDKISI